MRGPPEHRADGFDPDQEAAPNTAGVFEFEQPHLSVLFAGQGENRSVQLKREVDAIIGL